MALRMNEWVFLEDIKGKTQANFLDGIDPEPIFKKLEIYNIDKSILPPDDGSKYTAVAYSKFNLYKTLIAKEFNISSGQASSFINSFLYGWYKQEVKTQENEFTEERYKSFFNSLEPKLIAKSKLGADIYQKYIFSIIEKHPDLNLEEDQEFNFLLLKYFPETKLTVPGQQIIKGEK